MLFVKSDNVYCDVIRLLGVLPVLCMALTHTFAWMLGVLPVLCMALTPHACMHGLHPPPRVPRMARILARHKQHSLHGGVAFGAWP